MNALLLALSIALVTVCFAAKTAVVVVTGTAGVDGTVVFKQASTYASVRIIGSIRGLAPNALRGFHVHQYGNLTNGCHSTGTHFNPYGKEHGAPTDNERHLGDLGNIQTDENGVATFDFTDPLISLQGRKSIIGRSLVVHSGTDDLGRGNNTASRTNGNSGARVACGVIGIAN